MSGTHGTARDPWAVGSVVDDRYEVTGRCLRAAQAHLAGAQSVALTADADFAVSGGDDGRVRLWALDWELDAG